MKTTTRRYTSPKQAPRLTTSPSEITTSAGIVCLHAPPRRQSMPLVTFEWGRVAISRRGR